MRFTLDFDVTHPAIPQALDYLANSQGLSRTAWLRQVAKVAFDAAVAAGEVPRAIAAAVPDDWLTADTVYLESPCAEPRKK